jgi:hypothetical protein
MKDIILTIFVILITLIGLPIFILWFRDKVKTPSQKQVEEYSRRFKERLFHPDLDAVASYLDCQLPLPLVALYKDQNELMRGDFYVASSVNAPESERWYVAFYLPADAESSKETWPTCKTYFEFANDGSGNSYIIDPHLSDPPVKFYDHETDEILHVCNTLSQFMAWPRFEIEE